MDQALQSLQGSLHGSPRSRPPVSVPAASPKVKVDSPLKPPVSVARGPGSLAARAAARYTRDTSDPPLIPIPDIVKSPKSASAGAARDPFLASTSPCIIPNSPDPVASWVEGVKSPLADPNGPHSHLPADPAHDVFAAEFGDELGGSHVGAQAQTVGVQGAQGPTGDDLGAMTDEQFEAYRLQLEREEAEMVKGMEGDGGLGDHAGQVGGKHGSRKADSVLFGEGGGSAPRGKDPLSGRKESAVI